ncbi:MAG: lysylphosphatidylglycerol synthase transmembrane domain-containing protein [Pseudomonadota bacterium]
MRFREFFRKWIQFLGLVGFSVLVAYVGPANIISALKGAEPAYVLVALVINVPLVALKAFRWCLLMRVVGIEVSLWTGLRVYFASLFIGFLTPGRVGEFVKAAYVSSKTGAKLSTTLPSAVIDRLFDLYVLTAVGMVGLFRYSLVAGTESLCAVVVVALLLLILPLFGVIGKTLMRRRGSQRVEKLRKKLPYAILEAVDQVGAMTAGVSLICVGITIFAYLVFFFQCQIEAWAVHLHISFVDMILVMSVTSLVSLIPVSVAGIGVRDASLVILLGKIGAGDSQALAFSLMVLVASYIGGGLIGACCWLWDPIEMGASSKQRISTASQSNHSD